VKSPTSSLWRFKSRFLMLAVRTFKNLHHGEASTTPPLGIWFGPPSTGPAHHPLLADALVLEGDGSEETETPSRCIREEACDYSRQVADRSAPTSVTLGTTPPPVSAGKTTMFTAPQGTSAHVEFGTPVKQLPTIASSSRSPLTLGELRDEVYISITKKNVW